MTGRPPRVLCTTLLMMGLSPLHGQQSKTTVWHGTLGPSGADAREMIFQMPWAPVEPGFAVVSPDGLRIVTHDLRFEGTIAVFSIELGQPVSCSVDAVPATGYAGSCSGSDGVEYRVTLVPPMPGLLIPTHEVELARSAAPTHLAKGAAVYVFTVSGYELWEPGDNGFSCLIERPSVRDLWPICWNAEGTERLVPAQRFRARLRAAGFDDRAVEDSTAVAYRAGRLVPPQSTAIGYMMSPSAWTAHPDTGNRVFLPPHLHLYSPYATNADLGFTEAGPGPSMGFHVEREGQPDASIIVRIVAPREAEGNGRW